MKNSVGGMKRNIGVVAYNVTHNFVMMYTKLGCEFCMQELKKTGDSWLEDMTLYSYKLVSTETKAVIKKIVSS